YNEYVSMRCSGGAYTWSVTRSASPAWRFDTWWMSLSSLAMRLPSTKSRDPVALTWPLGASSNNVSVNLPRNTRTTHAEPLWSWIGERWPFFQHSNQAW